jgi:predicted DNA-binding transcriptional regulator AlpA
VLHPVSFERSGVRQNARNDEDQARSAPPSAALSPIVLPILLTDDQSAQCLGVSVRKFHELRAEPWMPRPVCLGPRLLRWVRSELEQAAAAMPRQEAPAGEPAHLQRGREARRVIVKDGRVSKVLG